MFQRLSSFKKLFFDYWELLLVSFLSLFLELLIIRLIGTEIRIFAYLSNIVLLAVFVGLGLGMLIKKEVPILWSGFFLFLITVIVSSQYIVRWPNLEFKLFTGITELLAPLSEAYIWLQLPTYSKTGIIVGLFLTAFLFLIIMAIFVPIGQLMGKLLGKGKPITAYSVNIFASILGIWLFQAFSLVRFTPYFGIIIGLGALIFLIKEKQEKLFLLIIFAIAVSYITPKLEAKNLVFWSPYQKLSLSPAYKDETNPNPQPGGVGIWR